jgi:hypothetical protein
LLTIISIWAIDSAQFRTAGCGGSCRPEVAKFTGVSHPHEEISHQTFRKLSSPKREEGEGKMMEIKLPRRVSEILKTIVENRHGEKLGTIQDFIVGVDGRLKYAILSHGGFLGIGDVLIPIPFDSLMAGREKGTVVLDIDKQTLEKSLNFESKTWPDFTSAEWEEKIDRYFAAYAAGARQPQAMDGGVYRDQPREQI